MGEEFEVWRFKFEVGAAQPRGLVRYPSNA